MRQRTQRVGDHTSAACECCGFVYRHREDGDLYKLGRWTLNRNNSSKRRPNFVLQVVDHVPDISELTAHEREELGRHLSTLAPLIQAQLPAGSRVYFAYMNEAGPANEQQRHVHVHLLSRFPADVPGDPDSLLRSHWAPPACLRPETILRRVASKAGAKLVRR